jgi:hypothetical protein
MNVKNDFFARGSFELGNGMNTRSWEDIWLGEKPIAEQYPSLYNIVNRKNDTVAHVLSNTPLNIGFQRALTGNNWDRWLHLVQRLMQVHLSTQEDVFKRKVTTNGLFMVKLMYLDLINGHTRFLHKYIWKIKVSLKIRIFMWFLHKKVIQTKNNLAKRNWNGCKIVLFL